MLKIGIILLLAGVLFAAWPLLVATLGAVGAGGVVYACGAVPTAMLLGVWS